ncbi:MAG: hypothetical protein VST70_05335, partial [Nitrospirota bacterium]|nr:hypothetical protein [Nitrospirota bacterium]
LLLIGLAIILVVYTIKIKGSYRGVFLNVMASAFQVGGTGVGGVVSYYGFKEGIKGKLSPSDSFTWMLLGFGIFFGAYTASGLLSVRAKKAEEFQNEHDTTQFSI